LWYNYYKAVSSGGRTDRAKDHIVTTLTHPDFLLRFFDDHQKRLFRNFSAVWFPLVRVAQDSSAQKKTDRHEKMPQIKNQTQRAEIL
jgi:hypothetical protein